MLFPNNLAKVGVGAFQNCQNIVEISFGEGTTTVADRAFLNCSGLNTILFKGKIQGGYAPNIFKGCNNIKNAYFESDTIQALLFGSSSLENVIMNENAVCISEGAFHDCTSLANVVIGENVETIGGRTFSRCFSLSDITIPNCVIQIGSEAFSDCALQNISIPKNVKELGNNVFYNCSLLQKIIIEEADDTLFIGSDALCPENSTIKDLELYRNLQPKTRPNQFMPFRNLKNLQSVTIGRRVLSIDPYYFEGCTSINKLIFEDGEENLCIGDISRVYTSFSKCPISTLYIGRNLSGMLRPFANSSQFNLTFGEKVTTISGLSGCYGLTSINIPNNVTSIGGGAFSGCAGLTSIEIPNSVTEIGSGAFSGCTSLNTITLPKNLSLISGSLFDGCESLTTIFIPEEVTEIGGWAFNNCSSLTSLVIPDKVTNIGIRAFYGCSNINSIVIPSSVKVIGNWAFYGCTKLQDVVLENGTEPLLFSAESSNNDALYNCPVWEVSIGRHIDYSKKSPFQLGTIKKVTINTDLTSYDGIAFRNNSIDTVLIKQSVTKLGSDVLYMWNGLKCVIIEDGTEPLDFCEGGNFNYCPLDSVYLGRIMNYTSLSPFRYNREGLKHLSFGDNVTELGDVDFVGHVGLSSLTLPPYLRKIGSQTFYGCEGLTELSIPQSVVEIGDQAFDLCRNLTSVKIEDGTTTLAFIARQGYTVNTFTNSPLKKVYMGRNFSFPNISPFSMQEDLDTIAIGEQVTTIANKSFTGCPKLKDVISYAKTVPTTGEVVFTPSYLPSATLHVPYELYNQYKVAPTWKDFGNIKNFEGLYNLTYIVDGEVYKDSVVEQNSPITPEAEPTKDYYTFSGWSEIPETMPDHDVTITGSFIPNKYKLIYQVDGVDYVVYDVAYGSAITPETDPVKEGYTFSGWSEVPETMPAHDVTIYGTFTVNTYKLTYVIDDAVYKVVDYKYGEAITPEPQPEGNYASFEWVGLPETMPAKDVTVYASYVTGISDVMMLKENIVRIYSPNGKVLDRLQKGLNIVLMKDGTIKKIVVK